MFQRQETVKSNSGWDAEKHHLLLEFSEKETILLKLRDTYSYAEVASSTCASSWALDEVFGRGGIRRGEGHFRLIKHRALCSGGWEHYTAQACSWQPLLFYAGHCPSIWKTLHGLCPFPHYQLSSDCLGVQASSVGAFQKPLYMFALRLLQSGLSTEKWTVNGLAFLTQYDILALGLLISLVLGILASEARQFMSI